MAGLNEIWNVGSDTLVEHTVRNEKTDLYPSDATVTANLEDSSGIVVSNGSGLTGSYVTNSDGIYQITVPENAAITAGNQYTLIITTTSEGLTDVTQLTREAKKRSL